MVLTFTPFITYRDIKVKDIDLIEDAFAFKREFSDVIDFLRELNTVPDRQLTEKLLGRIRKEYRKY